MTACDHRAQLELETKEKELAAKVRAATFDQLKGKLQADIEALRARLPTKESEAAAAAQDQFYLQDRQQSLGQE